MSTFFHRSTLLCAIVALLLPAGASAQSFDEFDDEFEEDTRDEADTRRAPDEDDIEADSGDDEFGDDDATEERAAPSGDDFGDEDATTDETPAATAGTRERPRRGEMTDARGDLINANGSERWRHRRFAFHNSWYGPTGGIHVIDAGSGPSQSFRVSLLTHFFEDGGFLDPGSRGCVDEDGDPDMLPGLLNGGCGNQQIGGVLSLSYTPWDFLEIFASIGSRANSNPEEIPVLFQVLGDTYLGVRAFGEIAPWFTVGGDITVAFLNTVGDIGLVLDSTSVGLRVAAAVDLRAVQGVEFPFVARVNAQYWFDNSERLIAGVETARYNALPDPMPIEDENRHLLTRVERFALGINRTDFFNIGIGTEWPIEPLENFVIAPILEWTVGVPVNRNGYSCLFIPDSPGSSTPLEGEDGCLDVQGFASFPSTLTLGLRVHPPIGGLGITIAVDIGTSGMNSFVRELSGNAPYNFLAGLSYAVDTIPPYVEPEVVTIAGETVEVRIPPPVLGHVLGTVTENGAGTAIEGALATITSGPGDLTSLSAISTNSRGEFRTYDLAPGDYTFSIAHDEYHSGSCSATVPEEGGEIAVACGLDALPRLGSVDGRVVGDTGGAVAAASVTLTGPTSTTLTTDGSGHFARADLTPGTYSARVEAENFFIGMATFEVRPREEASPEITIIARPARSLVTVRTREISIRRQVNFATDSADILPDSIPLLTEIADVLLRHPEIRRVEIQGHTDNRGGREHNMDLSQRRAEAVRDWLVAAGVDAGRLEARGYGDTDPVAPNLTAANRARNRRVAFVITEREEAAE